MESTQLVFMTDCSYLCGVMSLSAWRSAHLKPTIPGGSARLIDRLGGVVLSPIPNTPRPSKARTSSWRIGQCGVKCLDTIQKGTCHTTFFSSGGHESEDKAGAFMFRPVEAT